MIANDEERRKFYEGVSFAPDHVVRDWATAIEATWSAQEPIDPKQDAKDTRDERSYGAALAIIEDFRLRQDLGEAQSPETLRWLAEALGRILAHKDPLHSLGLMPRPKHRQADPETAIDVVCWVRSAEGLGHGLTAAIALAADVFKKDVKTIERYRAKAGEWADCMNPDGAVWTRYFAMRGKPLPPPKDRN